MQKAISELASPLLLSSPHPPRLESELDIERDEEWISDEQFRFKVDGMRT